MVKTVLRIGVIPALALLCGCQTLAPKDEIANVTAKFSTIVQSSTEALAKEIASKSSVRRDEVLMYYLVNGDDPAGLTRAGVQRSFSNYVCVGAGSLATQSNFMDYAKTYADGLNGITKEGAAGFAGQLKRYRSLQDASRAVVAKPEVVQPKAVFDKCVSETEKYLAFRGIPVADFTNESPLAAIIAIEALVKSIEQAAGTALKIVNEVESRRLFSELIKEQHEEFQAGLASDLDPERLANAWDRRKASALWRPYRNFSRLLELDPTRDRDGVLKAADEVNKGLGEYDALRAAKSPVAIVAALAKAEEALYDVATNKDLSPRAVLSFLSGIATDVEQLKKDYEAIEKASNFD